VVEAEFYVVRYRGSYRPADSENQDPLAAGIRMRAEAGEENGDKDEAEGAEKRRAP
jgi:hypothetical protein